MFTVCVPCRLKIESVCLSCRPSKKNSCVFESLTKHPFEKVYNGVFNSSFTIPQVLPVLPDLGIQASASAQSQAESSFIDLVGGSEGSAFAAASTASIPVRLDCCTK